MVAREEWRRQEFIDAESRRCQDLVQRYFVTKANVHNNAPDMLSDTLTAVDNNEECNLHANLPINAVHPRPRPRPRPPPPLLLPQPASTTREQNATRQLPLDAAVGNAAVVHHIHQ